MATNRMHSRIPSAKPVGCARLHNKRMIFNKKSKDGSGKANLIDSSGDVTWGVLYEIDAKDLGTLNKIEDGYTRTSLQVWTMEEKHTSVETYISTILTKEPVVCNWGFVNGNAWKFN